MTLLACVRLAYVRTMKKKPFNMKFDPALIERVDARAKERGLDRTALFTLAMEELLAPSEKDLSLTLDQYAKTVVKPAMARLKKSASAVSSPSVSDFHDAISGRLPKTLAKLAVSEARRVSVAKADIAEWGFRRPIAPKQPKKVK